MHAAREGKNEVTAEDLDYAVDLIMSGNWFGYETLNVKQFYFILTFKQLILSKMFPPGFNTI